MVRQGDLDAAPWIQVTSVVDRRRIVAYANLDLGEAEVLALGEETDARLLIIDEEKGRRFAQRLGFSVIGTLGVLLLAKDEGHLDQVGPVVEAVQGVGLYLKPSLVAKVLELAGES